MKHIELTNKEFSYLQDCIIGKWRERPNPKGLSEEKEYRMFLKQLSGKFELRISLMGEIKR